MNKPNYKGRRGLAQIVFNSRKIARPLKKLKLRFYLFLLK
jgi:hypothetical protein